MGELQAEDNENAATIKKLEAALSEAQKQLQTTLLEKNKEI